MLHARAAAVLLEPRMGAVKTNLPGRPGRVQLLCVYEQHGNFPWRRADAHDQDGRACQDLQVQAITAVRATAAARRVPRRRRV